MTLGKTYSKAEHQYLGSNLPTGVELCYLSNSQEYQLKHRGVKDTHGRILASRPRDVVINYRIDPRLTLNFIARRAMKQKGIPVEMKYK